MGVDGWSLVRFAHVTAAMGWVGGQLLLATVVLPVLRRALAPDARGRLVHAVARRFALVANAALLPLLMASGLALAAHRGVTVGSLDDPGYGRLLAIKLVLVLLAIGLAAGHGILVAKLPRLARLLARAGVAASLGVVVFATALVP